MTSCEQTFFETECRLCSHEKNRYGTLIVIPRTFVTCADDENKATCTNCGYSISLKNAQLNKQEVKHGNN